MADQSEREQELEWLQAQNISVSTDLVAAAKQHLHFLAAVDRNRALYDAPALHRAIYRYNTCWLPLLAKHSLGEIVKEPLVVPLDCEWIWHCHRLNPVQYKSDCEKFYGKILDSSGVVSSVLQEASKTETEKIWNRFYPHEPYELDLTRAISEENLSRIENCTTYDLVSAVKRQSPFFYQVSRPHMNNTIFLEEAVARYKGFLHLIKKNRERSIKQFCVPTYDIDLIWHTHQLDASAYSKDLTKILGKILEHDDMDADRTKGKKLDVGFSVTTRQWEDTFGSRYYKAGAMHRGSNPSPVTITAFSSNIMNDDAAATSESLKIIQLPEVKFVEVLLEIVGVKNLPEGQKGSFYVVFSKSQPDLLFNAKRRLTIFSESMERQVSSFQCEPTGAILFELVLQSPSSLPIRRAKKTLGTASLSLGDFLNPVSKLSAEKWLELVPKSGSVTSKPMCLRVAVSFTVPIQAPSMLNLVDSSQQSRVSCFFPHFGRVHRSKQCTGVFDLTDTEVVSLKMGNSSKMTERNSHIGRKQVIGLKTSSGSNILAEFDGKSWSLLDSSWSLRARSKSQEGGHLFELTGTRMIRIYLGRKLEFEPKHCEKQRDEQDFLTAIEFSVNNPYGAAAALLDFKYGLLKVKEEWLVLPAIISAFILSDILKNEGYENFIMNEENLNIDDVCNEVHEEAKENKLYASVGTIEEGSNINEDNIALSTPPDRANNGSIVKSGGCGGSGCGNMETSSGGCGGACGSGCGGSGCGNMTKASGCGGACGSGCGGSGCGNMTKASGCGGACGSGCGGSGCGNMTKASGCGGACGGGCGGNMSKSGGCGGGCSGACGNMVDVGNGK